MRAAHAVLEGRYEVERELDDETLLVRDRTRPDVPLQVLRFVEPPAPEHGGADALAWELARAREVEHPSVARVLEVGRLEDGRLWFTQEQVQGEDPFQWAPGRTPDEVVRVFAQLLRALGAFHARGLVVGGARALRARVQDDARGAPLLKLLDPGGLLDEHVRAAPPEVAAGEPAGGLAPERAVGARVDRRANLYEAGVFLRELLAAAAAGSGGLPRARDAAAADERSVALATFVLVLMSPAPDDRPPTVEAALETLAASTGLDLGPAPRPLAWCPGPLVGREALAGELLGWARVVLGAGPERQGAVRIVAPVSGGGEPPGSEPSLFVLSGEPGSGRRALLDRLAVRAWASGALVLRGRFGPGQGPAGPWTALARAAGQAPAGDGADEAVEALLAAARRRPLFVALEGLEAARGAALDALAAACRRAWVARRFEAERRGAPEEEAAEPAPRLLVVATAHPDGLGPAARAVVAAPFARERELGPLPARDLPRLAASALGGRPCPDALQERLALGARGLPGRVVRIVRDYLAGAPEGLPREVDLVEDARARLAAAGPEAEALGHALAVLARPAPTDLLAAACGLEPDDAAARLRALAREGVVEAWAGPGPLDPSTLQPRRAGSSGRARRPSLEALRAAGRAVPARPGRSAGGSPTGRSPVLRRGLPTTRPRSRPPSPRASPRPCATRATTGSPRASSASSSSPAPRTAPGCARRPPRSWRP
ncbi:MAG: hypothetical protein M9894_35505 [Planctomycetes bacterium]|nr:hypothetical protein [Planctomycetota bacterium]